MKRPPPPPLTLRNIKLRWRRSISTELAVSLVMLVLLVEGVLLFLIYNRQTDELYRRLEEKADEHAVNLSETLAVPIWDLDDEQTRRIGEGFARNELVTSVTIRGPKETVFYRFNRQNEDNPIVREVPILHSGRTIGHAEISLFILASAP